MKHHDTSPRTNLRLDSKSLVPNVALRQQIDEFCQLHGLPTPRPYHPPVSVPDEPELPALRILVGSWEFSCPQWLVGIALITLWIGWVVSLISLTNYLLGLVLYGKATVANVSSLLAVVWMLSCCFGNVFAFFASGMALVVILQNGKWD